MKRLTYEFVKEQFEKEGYELLSEEYVNAHTKLDYICPKRHKYNITWNNWNSGARCAHCAKNAKLNIDFIRSAFENEGYLLSTNKYKNSKEKLNYKCPNDHIHTISWCNWYKGKRCPYCAGNVKPSMGFIKFEFEKENYQLLAKKYTNNTQKLEYICPNGHKHNISWASWQKGTRCFYCSNNTKPNIDFIKYEFKKESYKLLSKIYVNAKTKLIYKCPKGHEHSITWDKWQQGRRCPYCVGRISKGEIEVRYFVKSLDVEILSNDRNQIINPHTRNGLELDIWIPSLSKAIEYNGKYWHQMPDKHNNDTLKQYLCKQNDIDLLIVWDHEWLLNNSVCKNKIKKFVVGI